MKQLLYISLAFIFISCTFGQDTLKVSEQNQITTYNGTDIFPVQTDSLTTYVWRKLTMENLKELLKDTMRVYVLSRQNTWDSAQTFNGSISSSATNYWSGYNVVQSLISFNSGGNLQLPEQGVANYIAGAITREVNPADNGYLFYQYNPGEIEAVDTVAMRSWVRSKDYLAWSETVTGLDYNNTTGVLSLTSGYQIPTTTLTGNWDDAYNKRVDTWGDGLQLVGNTASVDYNTTNLKITSTELNTIQNIATTSNPAFNDMTLNGELNQEGTGNNTFDGNLQTDTYSAGSTGWQITPAGAGDFRELFANELQVRSFTTDISQALAGSDYVTKSVAILSRDYTTTASSNTIYFEDLPGAPNTAVFSTGDWVRLRVITRTTGITVADYWGTVSSYSDLSNGEQSWTITRQSGSSAQPVYKGSLVLDYGTSGDGIIERTVIGANSPYGRIATWTSNPYTGGNFDTKVLYGNLAAVGLTGFGFYADDNIYISDMSGGTGIELSSASTKSITTGFSVWNPADPKMFIGNSTSSLDWDYTTNNTLTLTNADLDAVDITGSTITGGTIQTAASENKIVLSGNELKFYNGLTQLVGTIYGEPTATVDKIMHIDGEGSITINASDIQMDLSSGLIVNGYMDAVSLQIGSTEVIDASRNATFEDAKVNDKFIRTSTTVTSGTTINVSAIGSIFLEYSSPAIITNFTSGTLDQEIVLINTGSSDVTIANNSDVRVGSNRVLSGYDTATLKYVQTSGGLYRWVLLSYQDN